MKTPDEIKKGLDICRGINAPCEGCPYNMETLDYDESVSKLHDDALAYIQQLETEKSELLEKIKQLEQVRDAAVRDCARFPCYTCAERENGDCCPQCRTTGTFRTLHEWRGVCPENSPKSAK